MSHLKIRDLEPGKPVSELVVRVVSKAAPRIITTRTGRKTQLTEVLVADETGTAVLTVWGFGESSGLSVGAVIRLVDGWAKEWQGRIQITLGRSGRYEVVPDDGTIPSIADLGSRSEQ